MGGPGGWSLRSGWRPLRPVLLPLRRILYIRYPEKEHRRLFCMLRAVPESAWLPLCAFQLPVLFFPDQGIADDGQFGFVTTLVSCFDLRSILFLQTGENRLFQAAFFLLFHLGQFAVGINFSGYDIELGSGRFSFRIHFIASTAAESAPFLWKYFG